MKLPPWVRIVFVIHGIVTAAAAVVLIVAPQVIPLAIGIHLPREANLVSYLLGAVELGVAVLSVAAAWLADSPAVRLIAMVFVVMHAVTALVEIIAITEGASPLVWANVAFRVVVAGIFVAVALRRGASGASANGERVEGAASG
jgi:hypothetical protein